MPASVRSDAWRNRLSIPSYQVGEAARYAKVSPQTVVAWQRDPSGMISSREAGAALSYLQLIEVAVVAAFRKAGVPLKEIRAAKQFLANEFKSEFPFAQYRFKSDGKNLFMEDDQFSDVKPKGFLLRPALGGQLAWNEIIGRLDEFKYESNNSEGIVVKWSVGGLDSHVIIDPRIAFGAPNVRGVPTWVLKGRWEAGESIDEISADYDLERNFVVEALQFEGIESLEQQVRAWKQ